MGEANPEEHHAVIQHLLLIILTQSSSVQSTEGGEWGSTILS